MIERYEQKIATLSLVSGTTACNARCPFCISKMTPTQGMEKAEQEVNWPRFDHAFKYAMDGQADSIMITGKGEPTLFPEVITQYLQRIRENEDKTLYYFQYKQLQTNGIRIEQKPLVFNNFLPEWRKLGLDTIAISVIHYEEEENRKIYLPYSSNYINLSSLIDRLHGFGFRPRLACIMVNGLIDSPQKVEEMIEFASQNNVEELTLRPVNKPEFGENNEVCNWTQNHSLPQDQIIAIHELLASRGSITKKLPWGGVVYSVDGQNVCLTNSLTQDDEKSPVRRQIVFYPNGIIAADWTKESSILP